MDCSVTNHVLWLIFANVTPQNIPWLTWIDSVDYKFFMFFSTPVQYTGNSSFGFYASKNKLWHFDEK